MDVAIDGDEDGDIEIDETKVEEKKEVEEVKAELNEAITVINTLKSELNEVNLLNAKLLYVNKLFRSKTLTESQKVKVINAFDRAESVKEVKNIFETIKDAVTTETKKPVNESRSFASKAAGVAPKKPIVESNDFVARMQKLAGII
jgi:prolyl oligopeptidase PreP (S9A serine peptidase family)